MRFYDYGPLNRSDLYNSRRFHRIPTGQQPLILRCASLPFCVSIAPRWNIFTYRLPPPHVILAHFFPSQKQPNNSPLRGAVLSLYMVLVAYWLNRPSSSYSHIQLCLNEELRQFYCTSVRVRVSLCTQTGMFVDHTQTLLYVYFICELSGISHILV